MSASLNCTLLLVLSIQDAPVQEPFPQPGAEPAGSVSDENGQPLANARVALRWDAERSKPWSKSIEQVLQRTPLPSTLTNRNGEFALALTNDQRTLGSAAEGCFWLQVEHPGFQRWCEPLHGGISGWLGSRVVLHALTPGDRVEIHVLHAPRDARLEVRRLSDRDLDPGVDAAVPASGVVAVDLPLVPAPKPTLSANELLALGYRARLVAPDRCGAWRPLEPGCEWDAGQLLPRRGEREPGQERRTESVRILVTDDQGKPIERARVLLQDGAFLRSGPLPPPFVTGADGQVRIDGLRTNEVGLRVVAPGCFPAELPPSADDERELTLQRARTVRLTTLAGNAPAPFTRLNWQLERPAARSLALQTRTVATDSLGRACLAVPAGVRVFAYVSTSVRMGRFELEEREDVQRAEADALPWSMVLVPFDTRLATSHWSGKGMSGDCLLDRGARGAVAFLTQAIGPHMNLLQLETDRCVPLELRAADLDPQRKNGATFVLDRRDAFRDRALAVLDPDGTKVAGARFYLKRATPGATDKPGYEGVEILAAPDGQLRLPLACSAKALVVLHPRYLRAEHDIQALLAGGRDGPLQVRLDRGVELRLRFVPAKCGIDTVNPVRGTISLGDELDGIEFRLGPRALTFEDVEKQVELAPLEAAPPGSFEARVWLGGKLRKKARLELVAGKPCVIEIE